jgi:tRNA modification GTPase
VKRDVIAAIATAPGRSAIGVVRLSGANLQDIMYGVLGRHCIPRLATFTKFIGADGVPIDSGISLYFCAPHSYTGEDVLELQGHGGVGVLNLVLARCVSLGARLAEPGEFTRRAFLNGKLDLAQAEAVADLIDASTEAAARAALRSLTGALSSAVNELDRALLSLRTRIEAQIDFPEEGLEPEDQSVLREELRLSELHTRGLLDRAVRGKQVRDGIKVALVGAPNVGKSSLLNYLAGDSLAIVTDVPGTTRDSISVDISMGGLAVTVADTAGIRPAGDSVEQIGVERALEVARRSDLCVIVDDITASPKFDVSTLGLPPTVHQLAVVNKADLLEAGKPRRDDALYVSARTGVGIEELRHAIINQCAAEAVEYGGFSARQRHVADLTEALMCLRQARTQASAELIAEELRLASQALGRITGRVTADDLLGHIFSNFCIGK